MYPAPAEVLRTREGTLADTPLPLLLHAILLEERTCTLDLKAKGIEKQILIEEGSPAACKSNLLHETLGRFLVERGKISEDQYGLVFAETMRSGTKMGDLLVSRGFISASDLYKQLQANLARKILDCFRWNDAQYRLTEGADLTETAVKMNAVQLILTGVGTFLPFEVVATHLLFSDEQTFGLVPTPVHPPEELRLSAKDSKLMNAFRQRPTFAKLMERTGMETEDAFRKLYAFCVLGLVDFMDASASAPAVAPPAVSVAAPPPAVRAAAPVETGAPADEAPEFKDALTKAFLDHRGKDPFALLEVPVDVQPVALRRAFLGLAERFSPVRCVTADSSEKAEALLVAYARAYGSLADPEQAQLWRKRREAARLAAQAPKKDSAAQQFKISTTLLDARSQFAEAKKRLDAGNHRGALEYFQYACDIEPKGVYRAHLAYTRFLVNPIHDRLALSELADVSKAEPDCEPAFMFLGEIQKSRKEHALAEDAFRKAYKINPQNRRALELAQEMTKGRKR